MAKTLTTNYSLGKWDDGDNPGATDLNANWTTIDEELNQRDLMLQALEFEEQVDVNAISKQVQMRQLSTKTSAYTVTLNDLNVHFNNSGAGGQVIFTLPSLTVGTVLGASYTFVVLTAQNIRLAPGNATDIIRNAGSASTASSGHIDNATIGGVVTIVAEAAGVWICTSTVGTWTVT